VTALSTFDGPRGLLASAARMRTLAAYDLFNAALRQRLTEISKWTSDRLGVPTALVSVVLDSAVYHAGGHGVTGWMAAAEGTPIEWAFCAHAVLSGERVYVVTDAAASPVHSRSPLVTDQGIRAYAGAPLTDPGGQVLGMHCVTATSPREFTADELDVLRRTADEIMEVLAGYRLPGR
jgi:GAF domain-containing protein